MSDDDSEPGDSSELSASSVSCEVTQANDLAPPAERSPTMGAGDPRGTAGRSTLLVRLRRYLFRPAPRVSQNPPSTRLWLEQTAWNPEIRQIAHVVREWDAHSFDVFTLYKVYDWDIKRIASKLDVPESQVTTTLESLPRRIYEGLKRL